MLIYCKISVQTKEINLLFSYYQFTTHSSLSGRPAKHWSGRECGESWDVWLALPRLPSGRRVAIPSSPHFQYLPTILYWRFDYGLYDTVDVKFLLAAERCHFVFQHAMVIDTRNSSILPRKGGLLKIHQVSCVTLNQRFLKMLYENNMIDVVHQVDGLCYGCVGTCWLHWGRCQFPERGLWDSAQQNTLLGLSEILNFIFQLFNKLSSKGT